MTEKEVRARVGEAIRARREWIGETQAFVADKLGMTAGSYANWEIGFRMPSVFELYRLARVMRCKASEFLPDDVKVDLGGDPSKR